MTTEQTRGDNRATLRSSTMSGCVRVRVCVCVFEREKDQKPFWLHKAQRHPLFRYESLLNDSQTLSSRTEVSATLGSSPWLSDGCACEYINTSGTSHLWQTYLQPYLKQTTRHTHTTLMNDTTVFAQWAAKVAVAIEDALREAHALPISSTSIYYCWVWPTGLHT